MITRHSIATVLTTTAIAYSICSPSHAENMLTLAQSKAREAVTEDVDRGLQNDVRVALAADRSLDGSYIAVSARGGLITLSGVVSSAELLARALQTTMSVPGVRHIENEIEVEASGAHVQSDPPGTR